MTPSEYLDACKVALTIESDYALAHALGMSRQAITQYRKGQRHPDSYAACKFAITLGIDPATVIADLESQHEKNAGKLKFWRDFVSRAKEAGAGTVRTLGAIFIAFAVAAAVPCANGLDRLFFRRRVAA